MAIAVYMHSVFTEVLYRRERLEPIIIRKKTKDHGTTQKVEYSKERVPKHSGVVLVEDVLTTGGSALRALQALKKAGLAPLGVLALVDRCEGADETLKDHRIVSLFRRSDFL